MKTLKQLFIPFETGIPSLAKEKKFNEECFGLHTINGILITPVTSQNHFDNQICSAPLYQQIIDWLEDTHRIVISRDLIVDDDFAFNIVGNPKKLYAYEDTRQKALNSALSQALNSI